MSRLVDVNVTLEMEDAETVEQAQDYAEAAVERGLEHVFVSGVNPSSLEDERCSASRYWYETLSVEG